MPKEVIVIKSIIQKLGTIRQQLFWNVSDVSSGQSIHYTFHYHIGFIILFMIYVVNTV